MLPDTFLNTSSMSRTESSVRLELAALRSRSKLRSRFVRSTDRASERRAVDTCASELSPVLCSGAQGTRPLPADTQHDPLSRSGPRAQSPALFQRTETRELDISGPKSGITIFYVE